MLLSSSGRGGVTPLRIILCGVALSAFASAVTAAILILDEQTLLAMRTWLAGDLAGLNWQTLRAALLPALAGLTIALIIAPRLNVLALGDKVALGLGVKIVQTRLLGLAVPNPTVTPWSSKLRIGATPLADFVLAPMQ